MDIPFDTKNLAHQVLNTPPRELVSQLPSSPADVQTLIRSAGAAPRSQSRELRISRKKETFKTLAVVGGILLGALLLLR